MESSADNVPPLRICPAQIRPTVEATNEGNSSGMQSTSRPPRAKVLEHFKLISKLKYRCEVCRAMNPTKNVILQRPKDGSTNVFWRHLQSYHCKLRDELKGIVQSQRSVSKLFKNVSATKQYYTCVREEEEKEDILLFIVRGRLPFAFVESEAFRRVWRYRAQANVQIYTRWVMKETARSVYTRLKAVVASKFTNVHRVSLTVDTWTSENNHYLLSITAHWIDVDWKLCDQVLSLRTREEEFDGETMGQIIAEVLAEFDLQTKVATVTTDNASSNMTMMRELATRLKPVNPNFSTDRHVPCVAHVLNLIVQAGMTRLRVAPMNEMASFMDEESDHVDISYRRETSSLGEAVARIRAVVRAINDSTQRMANYVQICRSHEKPNYNKVIMDCPTRWNSTLMMLRGAIEKKDVIDLMAVTVISSTTKNYAIDSEEWTMLEDFCCILEPFFDITNFISDSKIVTATMVLAIIKTVSMHLDDVLDRFDNNKIFAAMKMLPFAERQSIRAACEVMKQKFDKYAAIIHRNQGVSASALLDPTTKLALIEPERQEDSIAYLRLCLYTSNEQGVQETPTRVTTPANQRQYTSSLIAMTIKHAKAGITTKPRAEPIQELETYAADPCIDDDKSSLLWWKEIGQRFFPNLSRLAKEYLSVPATSTPSEQLFSLRHDVVTYKQASVCTESIELLCTLYNWMTPSSSEENETGKGQLCD